MSTFHIWFTPRCYSWIRKKRRMLAWSVIASIVSGLLLIGVFAADQWYVVPTYLNVRSDGKYGTRIVATLMRGDKVTVLESLSNGWKKVALNRGIIGYVNGRYLSGDEIAGIIDEGSMYTVSVANAFVRAEGLQTKVAVLKKDDNLEALDRNLYLGKWIRVRILNSSTHRYDNRIGYISKDIVQIAQGSDASQSISQGNWIEDSGSGGTASPSASAPSVSTPIPQMTASGTRLDFQPMNPIAPTPQPLVTPVTSSSGNTSTTDTGEINGIINDIFK